MAFYIARKASGDMIDTDAARKLAAEAVERTRTIRLKSSDSVGAREAVSLLRSDVPDLAAMLTDAVAEIGRMRPVVDAAVASHRDGICCVYHERPIETAVRVYLEALQC